MDLKIDDISINLTKKNLKKMIFIFNCLENGWNIKKRKDLFIFSKKHGGKKEILDDKYLSTFLEENSNIEKIIKKYCNKNEF